MSIPSPSFLLPFLHFAKVGETSVLYETFVGFFWLSVFHVVVYKALWIAVTEICQMAPMPELFEADNQVNKAAYLVHWRKKRHL